MTSDKIVDLFLGLLVQILELVHGGEFGDVETVGQHSVRLALEKMLRFVGSDVGDGSEDIARVCRCTLNTVTVVDATLTSFRINVKILQVIIKINRSSAKISTKKGSVSREDGCAVDAALLAQRKSHTC